MRIVTLNIKNDVITSSRSKEGGVCTYILHGDVLEPILYHHFGRHNLCLKVFKHDATDINAFTWHPKRRKLLTDCTKAQNLFALRGLAPFVYDIILVNGEHWAQVTGYVGAANPPVADLHEADIRREFFLSVNVDGNEGNWVNGYQVDFGGYWWKDRGRERYIEGMKERINKYASWGSNPLPYQSAFDLPAQRDMEHRAKMMKLDEVDFTGKTVLDLGCSLGLFCQDALQRSAKRAVGIERRVPLTDLCYEVANWYGYWNVDFLSLKFAKGKGKFAMSKVAKATGLASFDIVYALSVDRQIGYAPWMAEVCDDVFYLEGHVPDREHTYRERLEADFSEVEYLGMTRDHGPRPLFRCRKGEV